MLFRYFFVIFFCYFSLNAAIVTTDKVKYSVNENIHIHYSQMLGQNQDWIGLYQKGASVAWENVIRWAWTGDYESGDLTFQGVDVGDYEVRAFYNNSYTVEDFTDIKVSLTTVSTDKSNYKINENIVVSFTHMLGNHDWVGLYHKDASVAWENVIRWAWTGDHESGSVTLAGVDAGEYEVRVFFNNSYIIEASTRLSVSQTTVSTDKTNYLSTEKIEVQYNNMLGNHDWIAIYEKNMSVAWENVIRWAWTGDHISGKLTFDGVKAGEYEVRAFFNNSYIVEAKSSFTVLATKFDKIRELILASKKGLVNDATYICVGDSTRAISDHEGQYLFFEIRDKLKEYNVNSILQARRGHKVRQFLDQSVSPTWSEVVANIPGDGSHAIVDISLGINDIWLYGPSPIKSDLRDSINNIKAQKPKTNFLLSMPNRFYFNEQDTNSMKAIYEELAQEMNLPLNNVVQELMPTQEATLYSWYRDDGLGVHLSLSGQHLVADFILGNILPIE